MASKEQLTLLKAGVQGWNEWLEKTDGIEIDLMGADLSGADLSGADLGKSNLREAKLSEANLSRAFLDKADLSGADLADADLSGAWLNKASLQGTNLSGANLIKAYLVGANLIEAKFGQINLGGAELRGAFLNEANLTGAYCQEADFSAAYLPYANLSGVDLSGVRLSGTSLYSAILNDTILSGAYLHGAKLMKAHCTAADFSGTDLTDADLSEANLTGANLTGADISRANLFETNLAGADLTGATLINSNLVRVNFSNAKISRSNVYGVNVWDLIGEFEEQKDLVITPLGVSPITIDNIKVAQFVYLLLNNKEIRDVINTLTSKSVLILGRFAIPERKAILDTLREKLRQYDLLPIVFDFDRPTDRDYTETVQTLAGLSLFVIVDVTSPKSTPLEMEATVKQFKIPYVPIIDLSADPRPFAMMIDSQNSFHWVLQTFGYHTKEELLEHIDAAIISRALKKYNELKVQKASEQKILTIDDLRKPTQ
jgi:uncharacterized protein YjbI with pentapeptide repeats